MARPYRHPKTGIFWLRRVVPESLRPLVGKREEKQSLGTRDPEEARRLHAKALVEIDARWANLRTGESTLTEREAHALAEPIFTNWLALYRDDPSNQLTWHPEFYDQLILAQAYDPTDDEMVEDEEGQPFRGRPLDAILVEGMRQFAMAQAKFVLEARGLRVDVYSHLKLVRACAIALQRASILLAASAETGDSGEVDDILARSEGAKPSSPLPAANSRLSPAASRAPQGEKAHGKQVSLTLAGLLAGWWLEASAVGRKPSTYESYRNTLTAFVAFLGHDDAGSVTGDDVVAFKDHRLATPSKRTGKIPSAKTVKDSDLSALKTLFGWAVTNRKLAANPALGISIK